jgi:ferrochelatase
VDRAEDIPAFVQNIRRGRPAPAEVVDEVTRRFERIGGSPLMRITAAQADALADRLGERVAIAGRLWRPYPSEVIGELVRDGVTTIVSLPLAPQSVDVYHAVVREAALAHARGGLTLRCVPAWGLEPALIDAFTEGIVELLVELPEGERAEVAVVLTAHSLPKRIIDAGDPYERQFRATAAEVEKRIHALGNPTYVAFQSQGMTGDAWIGPSLPETFARIAGDGLRAALIAPIGFVADHVETLYDLDIEAQVLAEKAGLARLLRASAMNTRPRFIDALETIARRELDRNSLV